MRFRCCCSAAVDAWQCASYAERCHSLLHCRGVAQFASCMCQAKDQLAVAVSMAGMARTAWSQAGMARTAWSQAGMARTAWQLLHVAGLRACLVHVASAAPGIASLVRPRSLHAWSCCQRASPTHRSSLLQDYNQMDELRLESPRAGDGEQLQRSGSWLRRMFQ
jgi:hypothetical protein